MDDPNVADFFRDADFLHITFLDRLVRTVTCQEEEPVTIAPGKRAYVRISPVGTVFSLQKSANCVVFTNTPLDCTQPFSG